MFRSTGVVHVPGGHECPQHMVSAWNTGPSEREIQYSQPRGPPPIRIPPLSAPRRTAHASRCRKSTAPHHHTLPPPQTYQCPTQYRRQSPSFRRNEDSPVALPTVPTLCTVTRSGPKVYNATNFRPGKRREPLTYQNSKACRALYPVHLLHRHTS